MKTFFITFLLFLFAFTLCNAQFTGTFAPRQWVIGQGGGGVFFNQLMTFSSSAAANVQLINGINHGMAMENSSVADATHNFLFYTNGGKIFNFNHALIQGGDSLSPCPYTFQNMPYQGLQLPNMALFITDPGDSNRFYLFHGSGDLEYDHYPNFADVIVADKIYYTLVDKTLDSGNGGVISKNNIILNDTVGNTLSAIKHGNGRDWWVILRHNHKAKFYRWLVTPAGVSGPFVQNCGPIAYAGFENLKYNYITNQVIGFRTWHKLDTMYLDIYDFNRCTGMFNFNNTMRVHYSSFFAVPGGCELSSNQRYLYVGTLEYLHQFDLLAPNIVATDTIVGGPDSLTITYSSTYGRMQLGPDGRIYVSSNNSSNYWLNVINYPDSAGIACNAVQRGVVLPQVHFQDLPNVPLDAGPLAGSACDTLTTGMPVYSNPLITIVIPNPFITTAQLIFSNPQQDKVTLTVYNVLGNAVVKEETTANAYMLNNLKIGVYFYEVINMNTKQSARGKFVVE